MLVLTRKPGQSLIITTPDGKTIEITRFIGGRLGITADKDVQVRRAELKPLEEK